MAWHGMAWHGDDDSASHRAIVSNLPQVMLITFGVKGFACHHAISV
jgi:hypothetical protein